MEGITDNVDITNVNYCEKLKDAMLGMVFGCIMVVACLGVAGWNEYRNVANLKTIRAGRENFVSVACSPIDPSKDGDLVHLTCPLYGLKSLGGDIDALKGIPAGQRIGLSLSSYIEVLQWTEQSKTEKKENKVGGGTTTTTTYTYSRSFSSQNPEDPQSGFYNAGQACQSQNNGNSCVNWDPSTESWWNSSEHRLGTLLLDSSKNVTVGDFLLPSDVISSLGSDSLVTPKCAANTSATSSSSSSSCGLPGNASISNGYLIWTRQDSNGQNIQWLRQKFTLRNASIASVLAEQQMGSTFIEWESPYDEDYGLYIFTDTNQTATQLLDKAEADNKGVTFFLRILTLILVIVGLYLVTSPLTTIPDIIPLIGPFIGDSVGWLLCGVDSLIGFCCWGTVVAIAWLAYRPVFGIPMLLVSCSCFGLYGYIVYQKEQKKKKWAKQEAQQASGEKDEPDGNVEDEEDNGDHVDPELQKQIDEYANSS